MDMMRMEAWKLCMSLPPLRGAAALKLYWRCPLVGAVWSWKFDHNNTRQVLFTTRRIACIRSSATYVIYFKSMLAVSHNYYLNYEHFYGTQNWSPKCIFLISYTSNNIICVERMLLYMHHYIIGSMLIQVSFAWRLL